MSDRRTPQKGLPEPMVEALRQEWQTGDTASLIASHMRQRFPKSQWPAEMTRSSILGQIYRYRKKGIPGFEDRRVAIPQKPQVTPFFEKPAPIFDKSEVSQEVSPAPAKRTGHKPVTVRARRAPRNIPRTPTVQFSKYGAQVGAPKEVEPPAPSRPIKASKPISLFDLKYGKCRWPVDVEGASLQMYCGGDAVTGKSYCPDHLRRMTR